MTRTILHSRLSLFAACAAVTLGLTSIGVGAPAARAAGSQTATVDFASTTTVTFTGTELGLHAVNDVDQGYMTVAVDGGTPTTIDDYAPIRDASGVVWTSPMPASGIHTITITITATGTHDSRSSGNNIALDSVDVFTSAQ